MNLFRVPDSQRRPRAGLEWSPRPGGERRRLNARIGRPVVVLDPLAEPCGSVGQALRIKPLRIFVQRLVQAFRAKEGNMAMIDRESADRLSRRLVLLHHQVERRGQPGSVRARLAVDQQGVLTVVEKVDQRQQLARLGRLVASKGKSKNATPLACAVRTSDVYHVSLDDPPRRFRIEAR